LLEDGALRKILAVGRIETCPDTLAELSVGLDFARDLYLRNKVARRRPSAKEFTKLLSDISAAASRLADYIDIRSSPAGSIIEIVLSEVFFDDGCHGIDTEKTTALLRRLEQTANEARSLLPGVGAGGADIGPNEWVLAISEKEKAKEKGNREQPETTLFVDLRQLFIKLGGTEAIGRGGPLYKFVAACVKTIDDQISMLDPEPFRKLMTAAEKRRHTLRGGKYSSSGIVFLHWKNPAKNL
jgi:hypothetical protein